MSIQVKQVSDNFSVTSQISVEDVAEIARLGFRTIINNRPDREGGADQLDSAQLKAAAEKVGVAYFYIPVVPNNIKAEQVAEFKAVYRGAVKPVLGFCRTGNRAANIYAMATGGAASSGGGLLAWLKSKCLITRFWRWCKSKRS